MKGIFKSAVTFLALLSLIGCVGELCTSKFTPTARHDPTIKPNRKIKSEDVILSENSITNRNYEVIGDISVTCHNSYSGYVFIGAHPDKEMVNKRLKNKAAEFGADAVITVKYSDSGTKYGKNVLTANGQAIRFIN